MRLTMLSDSRSKTYHNIEYDKKTVLIKDARFFMC